LMISLAVRACDVPYSRGTAVSTAVIVNTAFFILYSLMAVPGTI